MNLETNYIFWDMVTKRILEVSDDFEPVYGSGISFTLLVQIESELQCLLIKQ
ncbi:hypothetical protein G7A72_14040 [Flavobacterium sp. Sr18]|uniref:hypothetical protein n=1 Tax=Flavobacterium sp. Sr18 TaxID=935222 RepID=UPI0013E4DD59|nr:hypothetical protein [Flavobacterium sp. Sr18]QIH39862.1 hypothetical protein G7A72_14040 [Flavobacterium sp. Sr18]